MSSPGALTMEDIASLRELYADLTRICTQAQNRGVKVIVDAEYSWYQPAIDALTLALTREFNKLPSKKTPQTSKVQPLVYGTYQAYLQRSVKPSSHVSPILTPIPPEPQHTLSNHSLTPKLGTTRSGSSLYAVHTTLTK